MPKAFYQTSYQQPTLIESGRVLDVDLNTYTLTATTEFSKKPQSGISWATPYQHYVNGEGFHFIPEVGSVCWLCFPSDGMRPFVLAWRTPSAEGNFRGLRWDMNPGDMYLATRDENFLILRRGGIVQIGGGPINQRVFLPINNWIKDFCENYQLSTMGGDLEWTLARPEDNPDGHRPTTLKLSARQFADDQLPLAVLQIGSHPGADASILTLSLRKTGTDQALNLTLTVEKEGNVTWGIPEDATFKVAGQGAFAVEVDGKASLKSLQDSVEIAAQKKVSIVAQDELTLEVDAGDLTVSASGNIPLTPGNGKIVYLGGADAVEPVALGQQVQTYLQQVDVLFQVLNAWVPVPTDGGTALKALLTAAFTVPPVLPNVLASKAKVK